MIRLRANAELKQTFERLIEAAKVPVKWNGIFVVVDNYMILQGEVRSLFFHFDTKKVTSNIIEIPEQEELREVGENQRVQNAINMILYAFGKWGTIGGVRVEKDNRELGRLFAGIMREYGAEPEYTPLYLRFYKNGIRITYEDVIQLALEYEDEPEQESGGNGQGLWHKMVWKRMRAEFTRVETTVAERRRNRLGNNFYMVGYLCPDCGRNLHMVVYPEGKEFRIETEEGGVLLARAATCAKCHSFFTPRPKKLFADGDAYVMDFEEDEAAYEDYLELLGGTGRRVSNSHCNEYEDGREVADAYGEEDEADELSAHLPELSEEELNKLSARMEEGFYPDERVKKMEQDVKKQKKGKNGRDGKRKGQTTGEEQTAEQTAVRTASGGPNDERREEGMGREKLGRTPFFSVKKQETLAQTHLPDAQEEREEQTSDMEKEESTSSAKSLAFWEKAQRQKNRREAAGGEKERVSAVETGREDVSVKADDLPNARHRYAQSERERDAWRETDTKQERDTKQETDTKQEMDTKQERDTKQETESQAELTTSQKIVRLRAERAAEKEIRRLRERTQAAEGKPYAIIQRVLAEVRQSTAPEGEKRELLEKLSAWRKTQADHEVETLVRNMPPQRSRRQYEQYLERIKSYEDADLTPYEEILSEKRIEAEKQEIADMVRRARKTDRGELLELLDRLRAEEFLQEVRLPYEEKIKERIRQADAEEIAQICPNPMQMSFAEGMEAYEKIKGGDFLPELKEDVLKQLTKRLTKIKTEECELLVQKLSEELKEADIAENPRHHFYPARKVLLRQASPEELDVIEFALASYAAGKGMFEYPIFVVDATRNGTGREGIILTPEHLYYSTLLNAYGVPLSKIASIEGSTGFLKKGLYMYQKDGTKLKLPYAVLSSELEAFGEVLDSFVRYLQEKPDSRSLSYLASERHETICCYRCGYEYPGGNICPKCGYRNNE